MNLVVFGAAGRTGRHVVERALGHGHTVRAFVHTRPLPLEHERLTVLAGDVRDADAVSSAVRGCQGVAFALSQGSGSGGDIHEAGIASVIYAMASNEVYRLAAVSAAGTFAHADSRLSLTQRLLIATWLRSAYADMEAMERRIMASALDWTIVRPVRLTDAEPTGDYRVSRDGSLLPKWSRVARADVAALVVKALETDTYLRRAVVIGQ